MDGAGATVAVGGCEGVDHVITPPQTTEFLWPQGLASGGDSLGTWPGLSGHYFLSAALDLDDVRMETLDARSHLAPVRGDGILKRA